MIATRQRFEVEHAGCSTCAERIRDALSTVVTIEEITIDEGTDTARVLIRREAAIQEPAVNEILAQASAGSGHEYRIKPGSWREAM